MIVSAYLIWAAMELGILLAIPAKAIAVTAVTRVVLSAARRRGRYRRQRLQRLQLQLSSLDILK